MVMTVPGGRARTVLQPRALACRSAVSASRPTYASGVSSGWAGGVGRGAIPLTVGGRTPLRKPWRERASTHPRVPRRSRLCHSIPTGVYSGPLHPNGQSEGKRTELCVSYGNPLQGPAGENNGRVDTAGDPFPGFSKKRIYEHATWNSPALTPGLLSPGPPLAGPLPESPPPARMRNTTVRDAAPGRRVRAPRLRPAPCGSPPPPCNGAHTLRPARRPWSAGPRRAARSATSLPHPARRAR